MANTVAPKRSDTQRHELMGDREVLKVESDQTDAVGGVVLESIRTAFEAALWTRRNFLNRWRDTAGWRGSYAQASRRLSEWLDESNPHRFPVDALPDLVMAIGNARFLDPILALESRLAHAERIGPKRASGRKARGAA